MMRLAEYLLFGSGGAFGTGNVHHIAGFYCFTRIVGIALSLFGGFVV